MLIYFVQTGLGLQNTLVDTITEFDLSFERIATTKGSEESLADGAAVVPTSWSCLIAR